MSDAEAYDALVRLFRSVSDEDWRKACAELANAGLPTEERRQRYLLILEEEPQE
jgi:predicted secreted protein